MSALLERRDNCLSIYLLFVVRRRLGDLYLEAPEHVVGRRDEHIRLGANRCT